MNHKNVHTNVKPRLLATSVAAGLMVLASGAQANVAYVVGTTNNVEYISVGGPTNHPSASTNGNKDSFGRPTATGFLSPGGCGKDPGNHGQENFPTLAHLFPQIPTRSKNTGGWRVRQIRPERFFLL